MRLFYISVIFLFLFNTMLHAQYSIEYEIEPILKKDRTDLKISSFFKSESRDTLTIQLITDKYGTPDLHSYITSILGSRGTTVIKGDDMLQISVIPNHLHEVSLEYVLSYPPDDMEGFAFSPVVNENYFSLAGCQWMLHIGADDQKQQFSIAFKDVPEGWKMHSSIGPDDTNYKIKASYNDLISSRIGGGGIYHGFKVAGKPVSVFIKGDFEIPPEAIFNSVERIVRLQRNWFNDHDQPFYNVIINERNGVIAGTAFDNQFVCFVSSYINQKDLNIILAHEMFHNWLPNKLEISTDDTDKYQWFSEGFTTYFSKKILMEADLIKTEDCIALINEEIIKITDSPIKNVPYSEIALAMEKNQFSSEHKNLAYWRGALIALIWDVYLKETKNKDLSLYIRELYKYASVKNGKITEEEFFKFSKNFGIDAQKYFESHIIQGKPIILPHSLPEYLSEKYAVITKEIQNFEPGFDIIKTKLSKKITGVDPTGNAYQAGLRNDMKFLGIKNASRGEGWSSKRPMIVYAIVQEIKKEFKFIPVGEKINTQQIIKIK